MEATLANNQLPLPLQISLMAGGVVYCIFQTGPLNHSQCALSSSYLQFYYLFPPCSVYQTAWTDHRPHAPTSSQWFWWERLPSRPSDRDLGGVESAYVLHLLGHHILEDVILSEQTCRVKG